MDIKKLPEYINKMTHSELLKFIAEKIKSLPTNRIQLVAIDGVDGAGKTVLADALARLLEKTDRPIIRASVDGFHNSQDIRYRLGKGSPQGFFQDSYNYFELKKVLLDPLSSSAGY